MKIYDAIVLGLGATGSAALYQLSQKTKNVLGIEQFIASPCSGHGFKHSAAIGEVLAELVVDGSTHYDISAFRLNRFNKSFEGI